MQKTIKNNLFWLIFGGVFLLSVLPYIFVNQWYIDLFSHFNVQYIIVLIVLLVFNFIKLQSKTATVLLSLTIIWNSIFIVPLYFNFDKRETNLSQRYSILCINLLSENQKYSDVNQFITNKKPDILVLLELSPRWENELNNVFSEYGYKKIRAEYDNFGIAVLSNLKMEAAIEYFGEHTPPSIVSNFTINEQKVTVLATHPVPPVNKLNFNKRNTQLNKIAVKCNRFSENLIVIGDFNTSSYSVHFRRFLKHTNLSDSRKGFGILPSWPADFFVAQTTLDHCLVGSNIHVTKRETGKNIGSDHLPVFMEFELLNKNE